METTKVQFNRNSEERRKRRTKVLFIALLLFLMALAGCVAFLRKGDMQITQVAVTGTRALDPADIQKAARADVAGNYAWVIPRSNILLFSKRQLQERLMFAFPGIQSLQITFSDRNTVAVAVTEKHADTIWCQNSTDCYFIDDSGLIYEPSPIFSDGVYTVFSGSILAMPGDVIRSRFVTPDSFAAIRQLLAELSLYPVRVLEAHFDPTGDVSLRISAIKGYALGSQTLMLVASDTPVGTVTQDLDLLLADKDFVNAMVSRSADLQTIDLRFPQKIYYKFKDGATVAAASATSTTPSQ